MQRTGIVIAFLVAACGISVAAQTPVTAGPKRGTLIFDGERAEGVLRGAIKALFENTGEIKRSAVIDTFVQLAGGSKARVVVIPTAWDDEHTTPEKLEQLRVAVQKVMGIDSVTMLHTRDRKQADSPEFVAPLTRATGVWTDGGQDPNLWESYLGTLVEAEVKALLTRGGVVAGTSAGAVIESSLGWVEWDVADSPSGGKRLRIGGTHAAWELLSNSTILPHSRQRGRPDLTPFIVAHPGILGIAIDEEAAAVVRARKLEVIGDGHVGIYDGKVHHGKPYYYLSPGDRFDLLARRPIN